MYMDIRIRMLFLLMDGKSYARTYRKATHMYACAHSREFDRYHSTFTLLSNIGMKIQLKNGLLHEYQDQLGQITTERDILQACKHPFILDMHYSFQTSAHAIIVTELVRGGDLHLVIGASKKGYLPEDRVRLYAAEIALALNHLHELGFIYRDLKPCNVLLGEDGHVVLADMGLATGLEEFCAQRQQGPRLHEDEHEDEDEDDNHATKNDAVDPLAFSKDIMTERNSPSTDATTISDSSNSNNSTSSRMHTYAVESKHQSIPKSFGRPPEAKYTRRKTTVGTRGYMAPELVSGKLVPREKRPGYNYTIDYWSLGVTIFELLCGFQPFNPQNNTTNAAEETEEDLSRLSPRSQYRAELERMAKGVRYPEHVK
jgi:serine/threonine protein kinase